MDSKLSETKFVDAACGPIEQYIFLEHIEKFKKVMDEYKFRLCQCCDRCSCCLTDEIYEATDMICRECYDSDKRMLPHFRNFDAENEYLGDFFCNFKMYFIEVKRKKVLQYQN
jgi:hypothetical protein